MWTLVTSCGLTSGCKNQIFLAEKDLNAVQLSSGLPEFDRDPREIIVPHLDAAAPTPADVNQPDRPPRYLTLQEAMAIALENGSTNAQQPGSGLANEQLATFTQLRGNDPTIDQIRVLALNPAVSATAIDNQLARFDTHWVTSMNWTTTDQLQQGLQSFQNGSSAAFATSFIKALPSGGTANISFLTDYRILTQPPTGVFGVLNPQYNTRLTFGIDQPLWRDYGSDINQLLTRHPQSTPFSPIPGVHAGAFAGHQNQISPFGNVPEGILISRIAHDLQKMEFERQLNGMVFNVEVAYWRLYQAYGQLYSFEEVMRIAHKSWMINFAKYQVGTIGAANYFPVLAQYQEFRGERLNALSLVIERERNLRRLLGLPLEDGSRLVPITAPNLTQYQPSFEAAIRDAMIYRPELQGSRENVRVAYFRLKREENSLKPDLRGAAQYSPVGFGNRLDGAGTFLDGTETPRTTNAFRSLATDHFNDWSIGLILSVPLGYRAEMANIRAARLQLAQNYQALNYEEDMAKSLVAKYYQDLAKWYNLIEMRRAERRAYAESVEARFKEFAAGKATVADFLLEAQRRLATAQVKEYEAIAEYNNTLAGFEWAKGTILHHNNVFIAEGPLPEHVQQRAVEHERERSKAHVLRYKPSPIHNPGQLAQVSGHVHGEPTLVDLPVPADITLPPEVLQSPAEKMTTSALEAAKKASAPRNAAPILETPAEPTKAPALHTPAQPTKAPAPAIKAAPQPTKVSLPEIPEKVTAPASVLPPAKAPPALPPAWSPADAKGIPDRTGAVKGLVIEELPQPVTITPPAAPVAPPASPRTRPASLPRDEIILLPMDPGSSR
jgi:outer membrane protein TolC